MSGSRRWFLAVPLALLVTGLLALLTAYTVGGRIESDLSARARIALGAEGLPTEGVSFDGRDATLHNLPAADAAHAADVVGGVAGVRAVEVAAPPPAQEQREQEERADPKQRVQTELDRVLEESPIIFEPESDDVTDSSDEPIAAVIEVIRTAPNSMTFEVAGHTARVPGSDPDEAAALSQARADAVAGRLIAAGIASDRVTAVGYGHDEPLPGGPPGAAENRRVEITVQ